MRREVGQEMAAVQELLNLSFEPDGDELVAQGQAAIGFWTSGISSLPAEWDRFIPNDLAGIEVRKSPVQARMRVSSGVDWLNLDMVFGSDGVAVSADELRMCLAQGKKLVRLEDGTYAPIRAEDVGAVLERMAEIFAGVGEDKRVPLSQAGRVQELMRMVSDQNVQSSVKSIFGKLEDLGQIESIAKPRTLQANLRPYQKDGFSWLVFLHNLGTGGILADDMGLGKTLQCIALLLWAKAKQGRGLNLVVAPTSVVPNWQREIEKFAPGFKTVLWQGPDRQERASELEDADVMITSYALLRRDEEFLQTLDFRYAILDEAQHIKNPAERDRPRRQAAQERAAPGDDGHAHREPPERDLVDLRLRVARACSAARRQFEEKYARPIERGDAETAQRLRSTIHPFVLRRTKQRGGAGPAREDRAGDGRPDGRGAAEALQADPARGARQRDERGREAGHPEVVRSRSSPRSRGCGRSPATRGCSGSKATSSEESGKLNALKEIVERGCRGRPPRADLQPVRQDAEADPRGARRARRSATTTSTAPPRTARSGSTSSTPTNRFPCS